MHELKHGGHWYPPITYYWTVPVILDHSYLVGKLSSSKIADTEVCFVSATIDFVQVTNEI